jgi:hypothetical protein
VFRPKSKQKTIFDHDVYLPKERVEALEKTWAGPFRSKVMPLIDEEAFRPFYHPDNGRPNTPVATLIAVSILKELHNLTDLEVLGSLEFDLRWQYALDITAVDAHICQKTLHTFRILVSTNGKAREVFSGITDRIIRAVGLNTDKQRLDSTHIISNMANLTRLGLFIRTIETFLRRLERRYPKVYGQLPRRYAKVYQERSGYFADVKSSRAKRRLGKTARHLFELVDRFRGHAEISRLRSYRLMARLLEEQCHIEPGQSPKIVLKSPGEIPADSLQNPADPDATYGRKGKGYKASLTETCAGDNPFQVITDVALQPAHACDQKDVAPVIERLEDAGHRPAELFADAGYGSGENILEAAEHEIELTAPITCGTPADSTKMQLADFETTPDGAQVLCCIKGHAPISCKPAGAGKAVVAIFAKEHCATCEFLPICLVKRRKGGTYRLRYKRVQMATSKRRHEQETRDFKERYKIRSGIEATISEAAKLTGLKRVWTRGRDRVSMAVHMKALAVNVKRYIHSELEKAGKALACRLTRHIFSRIRPLLSWCLHCRDYFPLAGGPVAA